MPPGVPATPRYGAVPARSGERPNPVHLPADCVGGATSCATLPRVTFRMLWRLGAVLALVAAVSAPGAHAQQQVYSEHIARYGVEIDVEPSGRLHVVETIEYVFLGPKHGILRKIPVRVPYSGTHDRRYPVSNVRVTGSPGTPVDTEIEDEKGYRVVRVGDPDRTITGRHTYVITYDLDGAINRFEGHHELYWNVIGSEWDVGILEANVRVRVRGPGSLRESNCFAGPVDSRLGCRAQNVGGRDATYSHRFLGPRQAMTVVLELPPGYVSDAAPILVEKWTLKRAFTADERTLTLAGIVLLGGLAAVGSGLARVARDREYAGQVPGLEPGVGDGAATEPAPVFGDRAGPVEWTPGDMPPGLMGLVLDEEVHNLDVTATIVDLAARGHLTIEELPRKGLFRKRDWRITRVQPGPAEPLTSWERKAMAGLFGSRLKPVVRLSELKNRFHDDLKKIKEDLYDEAMARGWFTKRPDAVRGRWFGIALGVTAAGGAVTYVLARWTTFGLVGLAVVVVGLTLLAVHRRMPSRTARGSAAYARALGFKRYLATAEADQLRAEEKANVFARYLPYAIVLGETDRWAKVFADLGMEPTEHVGWYAGPNGWSVDDFGDSMDAFSSTAASTISSTPGSTGGSSGSSGFSGGSSGGGGGGGGGGSW